MNRSTPGLPVHHQLLEFTQTHIHRVSDAIQPPHPLSSPSPPAPNPSQHQSFPMSQLFVWGGQNTGVSALASFLPKNTQDWSLSEWTDWISLQSKGLSRVFSNTTVQKHQFFSIQISWQSNSHIHPWQLEKPEPWLDGLFGSLNMISRLVKTFLPRSKRLLISWLQSRSAVILEPPKIKSDTVSTVFPCISHEVMASEPWSSISECWALSQLFHSPLSLSSEAF